MNLNRAFDPHNGFWGGIARLVDVVGVSLLWIVCCLPVVTIGPATSALYLTTLRCIRQGESHTYGRFFRSFRQNLKVGILSTWCACLCPHLPGGLSLAHLPGRPGGPGGQVCYYLWRVLLVVLLGVPACCSPFWPGSKWAFALWTNSLRFFIVHLPAP